MSPYNVDFHLGSIAAAEFLPPANGVWGKVIFFHLSAILFTEGDYLGRYPSQAGTPLGWYTSWVGTPPWEGTPPGRYTPGRYTPWQVHHPEGTPSPAGTPPPIRQVHPPEAHPLQQCMLGYGQQVGGTHPTGMHSCWT